MCSKNSGCPIATGRKVIQSIDETNPVRDFILAGDHPAEDAELQKLYSLEAGDARQPDRKVPSHPAVVAFLRRRVTEFACCALDYRIPEHVIVRRECRTERKERHERDAVVAARVQYWL